MPTSREAINNEAKAVFKSHIGRPLCGIYDTVDNSIVLFPCISKRVELLEYYRGGYIKGNEIDRNDQIVAALSYRELHEYFVLNYAPRFLYLPKGTINPLSGDSFLSAHEYVVTRIMGVKDLKKLATLRGFTVTQPTLDAKPIFDWSSGSLNSPRDKKGMITERQRGCPMILTLQKEVKDIIAPWTTTLTAAPITRPPEAESKAPAPVASTLTSGIFTKPKKPHNLAITLKKI